MNTSSIQFNPVSSTKLHSRAPFSWLGMLVLIITNGIGGDQRIHFNPAEQDVFMAPSGVIASDDGSHVFVACEATAEVLVFNHGKVRSMIEVAPNPSGLALSSDSSRLYVTCGGSNGSVQIVDTLKHTIVGKIQTGYQTQSPVISPNGESLYACNRFDNDISVIDLNVMKEVRRIKVAREPFSIAVTPDGTKLLVTHHLHDGPSNLDFVASKVSVVDVLTGKTINEILLPNGSTLLREIRISPDGRYAAVAHILARFHLPTTQIERGWINSNALSIIDVNDLSLINTVLLDNINDGAATPWAVAWSKDVSKLLITHAGTHELSVIDFPKLILKLTDHSKTQAPKSNAKGAASSISREQVPNDLTFLVGMRERVKLQGIGPRSVSVSGNVAWVANYFSDSMDKVEFDHKPSNAVSISLGHEPEMTLARLGELFFNDATLCFQGWQACSSCHSHDGRVDGMNWDNLNDGLGNPKNVKSLLQAHQTPPMMWLGVRVDSKVAVRAGIRHSLFTTQSPLIADGLDTYLASLKPMASPQLVQDRLSVAAERGKQLFYGKEVKCARCHKGDLFTDQKSHDVDTHRTYDKPSDKFDTPSLIEIWRTAPYLHDGSASSLKELLTTRNPSGKHGVAEILSEGQIDDLVTFLNSL